MLDQKAFTTCAAYSQFSNDLERPPSSSSLIAHPNFSVAKSGCFFCNICNLFLIKNNSYIAVDIRAR